MHIINYDTNEKQHNKYNDNAFLPSWPFRLVVVGSSGSGKTNLVMNMLLNDDGLKYDKLIVVSPSLYQSKYKNLIDRTTEKDDKIIDVFNKYLEKYNKHYKLSLTLDELSAIDPDYDINKYVPTAKYYDTIDQFEVSFNIDDINEKERTLVILDDIMLEKKQLSFVNLFSRGRHKNISVMYLSQSFFQIPKNVRLNGSHYILFNMNARELKEIYHRLGGKIEIETFIKMFQYATKNRFDFMFIDNEPKMPETKYRKNFKGLMINN